MQKSSEKIGLSTATLIGINSMIGAGIFTAPAVLSSNVGPAGLLTYVLVIIGVWCMAFSFAQLAQEFPEEGAFYTYAKQWGGHTMGIISSFSYLIGILTAMGLLARLAGIYLHDYFPSQSPYLLGLIALVAIVLLNITGGVAARAGQIISICCTALPIAAITLLCLTKADIANLQPFAPFGFANALRAMQVVIFGFFGFESTIALYGVVDHPQRNVPRALAGAILFVSFVYLLFITSIFLAIPASYFPSPDVPLSHPLQELFPDKTWLVNIIHFSMTASFLSVLNSVIWATSSLFISITHKMKSPFIKELSKSGWINKTTSVVLMGIIIGAAFTIFDNLSLFFSLSSLFIMFSFITSLIALGTVLKRKRSLALIIQTFGGILTASMIFGFAGEKLITVLFAS